MRRGRAEQNGDENKNLHVQPIHQQPSEPLPLDPHSSGPWDPGLDLRGLAVQEQKVAFISAGRVDLDVVQPSKEGGRETGLQGFERPVDGYPPPLAAGRGGCIALEEGERDVALGFRQPLSFVFFFPLFPPRPGPVPDGNTSIMYCTFLSAWASVTPTTPAPQMSTCGAILYRLPYTKDREIGREMQDVFMFVCVGAGVFGVSCGGAVQ